MHHYADLTEPELKSCDAAQLAITCVKQVVCLIPDVIIMFKCSEVNSKFLVKEEEYGQLYEKLLSIHLPRRMWTGNSSGKTSASEGAHLGGNHHQGKGGYGCPAEGVTNKKTQPYNYECWNWAARSH